MKSIIAVNNTGFIGIDNSMLWRCSADLKHFKALTLHSVLLVGHNTFSELPPLKDRELVVDERGKFITNGDWCIGGKKTYEKYCQFFTELHISHINDNSIGNVTFPDLTNLNPNCQVFNYHFEPNEKK